MQFRRLATEPLIGPHMDARMGDNICGPSVIRLPPWVERPLGRYYLYFADHCGSYLRLAFADDPRGPWRMHEAGCLELADSRFCTRVPENPQPPTGWTGDAHSWRRFLYPHLASPDVHVDEERGEIRLYFHGLLDNGDQLTRVALSRDGLHFEVREPLLAPCYLRAFRHADHWYGLAWPDRLWRSPDGLAAFERGPALLPANTRHVGLLAEGDELHLLWSQTGEAPERLYYGRVDLRGDWRGWRCEGRREVLRPELEWEGANEPLEAADLGASTRRVNQLRDPFLLRDADHLLLYYVGGGECGIGLAEAVVQPVV